MKEVEVQSRREFERSRIEECDGKRGFIYRLGS